MRISRIVSTALVVGLVAWAAGCDGESGASSGRGQSPAGGQKVLPAVERPPVQVQQEVSAEAPAAGSTTPPAAEVKPAPAAAGCATQRGTDTTACPPSG